MHRFRVVQLPIYRSFTATIPPGFTQKSSMRKKIGTHCQVTGTLLWEESSNHVHSQPSAAPHFV